MTQTHIASGAGLRHVRAYALETDGLPTRGASATVPYAGVVVQGCQSFTFSTPDPRIISHKGIDRVEATDSLPPDSGETYTLTTGKSNLTLDALLTDTLVEEISATISMGVGTTNKQGSEQQIAIMGWRIALDTDRDSATFGKRRYITRVYPSGTAIPKEGPMEDGGADVNTYMGIPTPVTTTLWGKALTEATNGADEAQHLRFVSTSPFVFNVWPGNNTAVDFTASVTPISTARTQVWSNGTPAVVSSVDTGTKVITLSAPPANNAVVIALIETNDDLN
jgi:hypothetical protein